MIIKRIKPDHDLKEEILKISEKINSAIIIAGVGSLNRAILRSANGNITGDEGPLDPCRLQ